MLKYSERKKIMKKIKKLEDQIFECRDPDNTIKGRRLLKEYNRLKLVLHREDMK